MPLPKCSDCGKELAHAVYDWEKKLPRCDSCFRLYLADVQAARETEGL